MALAVRSSRAEAMDEPGLDAAVYRRCLDDLAALNRVTMTHRAVLRWLRGAIAAAAGGHHRILDIGYGQGDLLRAIAREAASQGWRVSLQGIDLNPRAAAAARDAAAGMDIDFRVGDVFDYMPEPPPDFIVSSQFFHHLRDAEIVRLLRWMENTATRGWMVTDLHRHALPYYGFRFLARAMRWHRIVREDGTISIARGFTGRDWAALLEQAGIEGRVQWQFPFRHSVSRLK